jgi:hypothetical protein
MGNGTIVPDFDYADIAIEDIKEEVKKLKQNNELSCFPIDVFPSPIQEIVKATNETLGFPIDFIGASILYAASVAIGNVFRVEMKRTYEESAVLYMAIVARPGTNKTHPVRWALKPIIARDKKTFHEYEIQKQDYDKSLMLSKKEKEKSGDFELKKPVWKKFLLSDYTPEALAEVHNFNKRGIGVYVDELAGWFKNFNRYNRGSEMEFWLSTWSGNPINIDRKSGEPVFIPLPFISVIGTIQNGLLTELAKDSRTQNGFIDRILFVIPDNLKKSDWSETDVSQSIIDKWSKIINKILDLQLQSDETFNPVPEIYCFSSEAKKTFIAWHKKNTAQCVESDSDAIAGIYSKMDMYFPRLALILEILKWACDWNDTNEISVEATQGAAELIEYFKGMAVKVNNIVSGNNPIDKLPIDKQRLYEALPGNFTTAEGMQIADSLGMIERTFKRFLNDRELFKQLKYGEYEKCIC